MSSEGICPDDGCWLDIGIHWCIGPTKKSFVYGIHLAHLMWSLLACERLTFELINEIDWNLHANKKTDNFFIYNIEVNHENYYGLDASHNMSFYIFIYVFSILIYYL